MYIHISSLSSSSLLFPFLSLLFLYLLLLVSRSKARRDLFGKYILSVTVVLFVICKSIIPSSPLPPSAMQPPPHYPLYLLFSSLLSAIIPIRAHIDPAICLKVLELFDCTIDIDGTKYLNAAPYPFLTLSIHLYSISLLFLLDLSIIPILLPFSFFYYYSSTTIVSIFQ